MKYELIQDFEVGQRLDKVLVKCYPQYSRSSLEKLIERGSVLVNDSQISANYKVKPADQISVNFASFTDEIPEIDMPIIFENDEVIVLNKPAGVLTHSKDLFNDEATVASFIKSRLDGPKKWRDSNRPGIVHRLDRGTSGVIICAKVETAQKFLQKQFAARHVKKTYLAVISGHLKDPEGIIDAPIERNPKKPSAFRVGTNGKNSVTHYIVKATNDKASLIELKPTTGRTHQLRVHLTFIKHPIVGDTLYGGESAPRMLLHAWQLELKLPSKERRVFTSPAPKEFKL